MHISIHLMEVRAQCALLGIGLRIGMPFFVAFSDSLDWTDLEA